MIEFQIIVPHGRVIELVMGDGCPAEFMTKSNYPGTGYDVCTYAIPGSKKPRIITIQFQT